MDHTEEDGTDEDTRPSRTELKREAERRQKMGERLSKLADSTLETLNLPDELMQSLKRIRDMRHGGGLRRERQRIGALMRQIDTVHIEQLLAQMEAEKASNARAFHRLEQLRDQMLEQDESAFEALAEAAGEATVEKARSLAHRAEQETIRGQPPAAARELFRLIREHLGS